MKNNNDCLVYDKMEELKGDSRIIAIKVFGDNKYAYLILQKYLFKNNKNVKVCDLRFEENFDNIFSYKDNGDVYDYIVIQNFNKFIDKYYLDEAKIIKKLYDYAKYEEINIIFDEGNDFIKNGGLLDGYITFNVIEDKVYMIINNIRSKDITRFEFEKVSDFHE